MSKQTVRTPQRIVKLVRYFEGVISNEKAPERLRMQAAERLTELFLEAERGKRERQIAIARAEARVEQARLEKADQGTTQSDRPLLGQPDAIGVPQAGQNVKSAVQDYLAKYVKTA